MESIREIYKIGKGPSSSHTMAPKKAAEQVKAACKDAAKYIVTLYGALASTGKGHMTDVAIEEVLGKDKCNIIWLPDTFLPQHPNGMRFQTLLEDGTVVADKTYFSVGGGDLSETGKREEKKQVYPHSKMDDILAWCKLNGTTFWEYVKKYDDPYIGDYLNAVWKKMCESVERGIDNEGVLPGVMYLNKEFYGFSEKKILRALATAGLIGTIIKNNASISGAEVGCQGEIGSACSMTAGAGVQLFGGTPSQIEYAASMGMEHFLGLTCDPAAGMVQIPCIERNAFAATRAVDANVYALMTDGRHRVSFDKIIEVMKRTGHDLPSLYKETSVGGIAYVMAREQQ